MSLVMTWCRAEIRTYHHPVSERMCYELRHSRGLQTKGQILLVMKKENALAQYLSYLAFIVCSFMYISTKYLLIILL